MLPYLQVLPKDFIPDLLFEETYPIRQNSFIQFDQSSYLGGLPSIYSKDNFEDFILDRKWIMDSNNYIINGKDSSSLFENSRFDVENGYLFLLLRFGIIGTIFFYFILKKYFHGIYFNFIIFYLLIFFASIGLSGISFFTLIFSFLFLKYFLLKSNYGFA